MNLSFQLFLVKLGRTEPTRVLTRALVATTLAEVGEMLAKGYPKYKLLEMQVFDNLAFSRTVLDTLYQLALQKEEREKLRAGTEPPPEEEQE